MQRPSSPTGDPQAEERLARQLIEGAPGSSEWELRSASSGADHLSNWVVARTEFFDAEVMAAVAAHVPQVVIAGAGYDGRALRFRTPDVRFFEIDHPLTQRDKRERLAAIGARADDVTFATADFLVDDVGDALEAAGHVAAAPTLFLCEGLLRYLTEEAILRLLQRLDQRAAPGSVLAVSISTRDPGETPEDRQQREAREAKLAAAGEAVLTVPPRATALGWLSAAGWIVAPGAVQDCGQGRLLVRATP